LDQGCDEQDEERKEFEKRDDVDGYCAALVRTGGGWGCGHFEMGLWCVWCGVGLSWFGLVGVVG